MVSPEPSAGRPTPTATRQAPATNARSIVARRPLIDARLLPRPRCRWKRPAELRPGGRPVFAVRAAAHRDHAEAIRAREDTPLLAGADSGEHAGLQAMLLAVDEERGQAVKRDVDLLLAEVVLVGRVVRMVVIRVPLPPGWKVHHLHPNGGRPERRTRPVNDSVEDRLHLVDALDCVVTHLELLGRLRMSRCNSSAKLIVAMNFARDLHLHNHESGLPIP